MIIRPTNRHPAISNEIRDLRYLAGLEAVLLRLGGDVHLDQDRGWLLEPGPRFEQAHPVERVEQHNGRCDRLDRTPLHIADEVPGDVCRKAALDSLLQSGRPILGEGPLARVVEVEYCIIGSPLGNGQETHVGWVST